MSLGEKELFYSYLLNATNYAEFGSGGSTVWANNIPTIKSIISVESDKEFAEKIQKQCPRAQVRWIDVGPTRGFGHPKDNTFQDRWHLYSDQDIGNPDTILIDGRWRVACALRVAVKYPHSVVLIHDFWNRPEYHCILPYYSTINSVDTLAILKPNGLPVPSSLYEEYVKNDN